MTNPQTKTFQWITLLIAVLAMTLGGCAVTEGDIEAWRTTVRGPGKIVAVLMADKYADPLRVRAGLALVEMEREDVQGVPELQAALRGLSAETSRRLVDGMTPGLIALMQGAAGAPAEGTPQPLQIRAKDASFLVLQFASDGPRGQLTQAVVDWLLADFNGRSLAGNFSAEQIIRAVGAPAASGMVSAMNAQLPSAALIKICELIGQLGDAATKTRAGERIVAIEREMEGPEFAQYLSTRLREQLTRNQRQLTEANFNITVENTREQYITTGALPAMRFLASEAAVGARLLEIANTAQTSTVWVARRSRALQAMEGNVRPDHVRPILALALSSSSPAEVRDYAIDRLGDARDRSIIAQLWPLATQTGNAEARVIRARINNLILTIGGPTIVAEWVGRLPGGADTEYNRAELQGYAERLAQLRPQPTDLVRSRMSNGGWHEQVIAIFYFDRLMADNQASDTERTRLRQMVAAAAATHGEGWGEDDTVGKVAQRALTAIETRAQAAAAAATAATAAAAPTAPAP